MNYPCAVRTPLRLAVCESCNRLYTCSTAPAISRQEPQIVFNNLFCRCQARLRVEGSRILSHRPTLTSGYLSLSFSLYRVSQEECARLREGVPYIKVYRYNPEHLCPKLNGYGDNGQRKVWSSGGSTHCTCQLTTLSMSVLECGFILRQFSSCSQ